jgi:hypothetical protein
MAAGVLDGSSDGGSEGSTDGASDGAALADGLGSADADADGDAIGSVPQAASANTIRLARMVRPIGRSPYVLRASNGRLPANNIPAAQVPSTAH